MPPYCEEHQMYYCMAYVDGSPLQQCVCVKCKSGRLSGFDIAQSAADSTEILNEVKADKGLILTEEELQALSEVANEFRGLRISNVMTLINSHRNLLSANSELSFYKNKYWEALNSIVNGQWTSYLDDDKLRVWQTDRINPKQIALEALEGPK